jgi:polyadenylate-binding protein
MDEAAAALAYATQSPSSAPSPPLSAPSPPSPQTLGERLYALIEVEQGWLAGKIIGMLLEGLDNSELVALIDDQVALQSKIQEALAALEAHQQAQAAGH